MSSRLSAALQRARRLWADDDLRRHAIRRILRPWRRGPARSGSGDRTPLYLRAAAGDRRPLEWTEPPALLAWGTAASDAVCDLALAATTMTDVDLRVLPWTTAFEDPEDAASLHRFAWLQPWLVARSQEGAAATTVAGIVGDAMRSWIAAAGEPISTAVPWQPYTVAERIVNWTIASLALGHRLHADEDVRASVVQQLAYLAKNLEYYGEALTGNHLSNDGRGLYIGGIAAGDPIAVDLGRTILLEERKRLFEEPWFAREGSSHYQFLITRNYMEALWFAERAGDRDLIASIEPTVARLVAGCRFLLVAESGAGERMPLIGDISPDCTPEWLFGVAAGSHPLLGSVIAESATRFPNAIASAEWGRIDAGDWTLFSHVNPAGAPRHHAHQDTGAIVAHYLGVPVVVDTGRASYRDTDEGRYGREWRAHSICVVDGLNPAPFWHWAYSAQDLLEMTGGAPELSLTSDAVTVTHRGFTRRKGVGVHRRVAEIRDNALVLSDSIDGSGRHRVDIVLHVPAPAVEDGRDLLCDFGEFGLRVTGASQLERRVSRAVDGDRRDGWAATRYGSLSPVTTIVFGAQVSLPWSGETTLRIETRTCAA